MLSWTRQVISVGWDLTVIHWERSLLRRTVCFSSAVVCVLTHRRDSQLPIGGELCGGRLTSSGHTSGARPVGDYRSFPFLFLATSHPVSYFTSVHTRRDVIKLSFIEQCKCEALLVVSIKPYKPHHCTPALWSLSSESVSWGQSHFTSSVWMSEWIEVGGKPIKEESAIFMLRATVKYSPTHTHTHISPSIALMFSKDGANKQKRDLLVLELLVLYNTTVMDTAITLPNVPPS